MKIAILTALILLTIPFGAYGIRELLRVPRRKAGLPIAPEVLRGQNPSRAQKMYWEFIHSLGMGTDLHREIAKTGELQPGEHVMDIGAGTGELALLLKTIVGQEGQVAAIDINNSFLHHCRRRSMKFDLPVDFRFGDAAKIPFEENTFDAVTCSLMAHHLTTGLKQAMFRETLRVLKPGGRLIFFDLARPRNFNEWYRVWTVLSLDLLFEWHCADINLRGEMPAMIGASGFSITKIKDHFMRGVRAQFVIAQKPPHTSPANGVPGEHSLS